MTHKWIATGLTAGLFLLVVFGFAGLAVGVDGDHFVYLPFLQKPPGTPTPGPQPTGDVDITDIFYDGLEPRTEGDEYVEIRNNDSVPIQLQGWTLRDAADPPHVFTFPSFVVQPDQTCRVYTDEVHAEACGFSYGSSSAIWNNDGDCAFLRNSSGVQVDSYCY